MKWVFYGYKNWGACEGYLDIMQSFDVFRAAVSKNLPRDICEMCPCWVNYSYCTQVMVDDWESTRQQTGWDKDKDGCHVWQLCCPILFFDFIGVELPVLECVDD